MSNFYLTLKGIDLDGIKNMQNAVAAYKNAIINRINKINMNLTKVDEAMAGKAQGQFRTELGRVNESERKLINKLSQFETQLAEVAKQYKNFDSKNNFAGSIK